MTRDRRLGLIFALFCLMLLVGIAGGFMQVGISPGVTGGSGTVNANSGSAGALAFYAGAGGSTTVGPDANLNDASNILGYLPGTLSLGSNGAAAAGTINLIGTNGGAGVSFSCTPTGTCTTFQSGTPWSFTSNSGISLKHLNQAQANNFMGTCTMSSGTTCTATINLTYTTPICFTSVQSAAPTTFQGSCALSGTTVTVTASVSNSNTWAFIVVGNPN